MIGYLLVLALRNELPDREVVALLTEVVVDADDPAFRTPTKPIGPVYSEREARGLARDRGWTIARDGPYFRRVVASPVPKAIVELGSIERLLASGVVVVCAGGGGIPVARNGKLRGLEAVVDKDRTAALLAEKLGRRASCWRRTCPTWNAIGAPHLPRRSGLRRRACFAGWSLQPARWDRRSKPRAASWSGRTGRRRSARSTICAHSCVERPGPRSALTGRHSRLRSSRNVVCAELRILHERARVSVVCGGRNGYVSA
jgi:hypothetical protein